MLFRKHSSRVLLPCTVADVWLELNVICRATTQCAIAKDNSEDLVNVPPFDLPAFALYQYMQWVVWTYDDKVRQTISLVKSSCVNRTDPTNNLTYHSTNVKYYALYVCLVQIYARCTHTHTHTDTGMHEGKQLGTHTPTPTSSLLLISSPSALIFGLPFTSMITSQTIFKASRVHFSVKNK